MKVFSLVCPHCKCGYVLTPCQATDWYQNHVTECRVGLANSRSSLAEFFAMALGGLKVRTKEQFRLAGRVFMQLTGADGQVLDIRCAGNLIVNAGKDWVIDRIQSGSPPAVMGYQAIGTGATAAAAGDTTLQAEVARQAGDSHTQPTSVTDRLITTFAAGVGTGSITETGRLNAASTGTLGARQVFGVVTKGAADSLLITHDFTI